MAWVNIGLNILLPSYDANGNVIAWSSQTGSLVAKQDYDPFGNMVQQEITASHQALKPHLTYGFSTKPADAANGLLYYGYRFYNPLTGRWINRDPIEERGGLNLYGFVGNDGVGKWDLLGLKQKSTQVIINLDGSGSNAGGGQIERWISGRIEWWVPVHNGIGMFFTHNPFDWKPGRWETRDASDTAEFGLSAKMMKGFTVDCESNDVKPWSGMPQVIGLKATTTNVMVGPLDVTHDTRVSDPRTSGPMNKKVTISDDGLAKIISWDVDGSATVDVTTTFKIEAGLEAAGWKASAGYSKSSTSGHAVIGSGKGAVTCKCNPTTGEWE